MKLLIIESEQNLRNLILQYFRRSGYLCESAANFREAYRKIVNHEYDGVVIDLNLPDGNGLKLVKLLRDNSLAIGIIILSDSDAVADKIQGLEQGADDYLAKPVDLSELKARIRAVLRRKSDGYRPELQFGDLLIKLDERIVLAKGEPLKLTKKEFDILVYLARNKNRVITKDSIVEHLWGDYMDDAPSFDFIYAHVKNLRKKLADHGCENYLETVYGIGYKFVEN
jgi:DNA-binding response OmpR family regulator